MSTRITVALLATMFAGGLGMAACEREPAPVTAPKSRSGPLHAEIPRPKNIREGERLFFQLAASARSSAGFYFDSAGTLIVQVRDSSDFNAARGIAQALISSGAVRLGRRGAGGVSIHQATFTIDELVNWRDSVFAKVVGQFRGITSLDMDERRNRVVIGLLPAVSSVLRRQLPSALADLGIDTTAVLFEDHSTITPTKATRASMAFNSNDIRNFADTIVGGVNFRSPGSGGTVGLVVTYNGVRSFLTCSHCTSTLFSLDHDTVAQPTFVNTPRHLIGYESADPSTNNCGTWPFNFSCRSSDAAIYTLFDSVKAERGLIARTTYSSHSSAGSFSWDTSNPYFVVAGTIDNPTNGTTVQKIGAASGWTYGTVHATCIDKQEPAGPWALCNTETDAFNDNGDSGGPTFILGDGNLVYFSGLQFANQNGWYYFSPFSQIDNDLTSSMTIARGANLSTPSLSGSVSSSMPLISWGSVSGATAYEAYRSWCIWDNLTFTCSSGSNGFEYIGKVYGTSYLDAEKTVSAYNGATQPGPLTYGYVGYHLFASGTKDYSAMSNTVYFTLSP